MYTICVLETSCSKAAFNRQKAESNVELSRLCPTRFSNLSILFVHVDIMDKLIYYTCSTHTHTRNQTLITFERILFLFRLPLFPSLPFSILMIHSMCHGSSPSFAGQGGECQTVNVPIMMLSVRNIFYIYADKDDGHEIKQTNMCSTTWNLHNRIRQSNSSAMFRRRNPCALRFLVIVFFTIEA